MLTGRQGLRRKKRVNTIGNKTYILIGNEAQLRKIGTDTKVYGAVYQAYQDVQMCIRDRPFTVAEQFTGLDGKYVHVEDTVKGFKEILEGKYDDLPEQAFHNVGKMCIRDSYYIVISMYSLDVYKHWYSLHYLQF